MQLVRPARTFDRVSTTPTALGTGKHRRLYHLSNSRLGTETVGASMAITATRVVATARSRSSLHRLGVVAIEPARIASTRILRHFSSRMARVSRPWARRVRPASPGTFNDRPTESVEVRRRSIPSDRLRYHAESRAPTGGVSRFGIDAQAMRKLEAFSGLPNQSETRPQGPLLAARQLRSPRTVRSTIRILAPIHRRQPTKSQPAAARVPALFESHVSTVTFAPNFEFVEIGATSRGA